MPLSTALKTAAAGDADAEAALLNRLFLEARTHNGFTDEPVPLELVRRAYDIASMGPTSMNSQPMRLVLLTTAQSKQRLAPALPENNLHKTLAAPLTLIIAHDARFFEHLPSTFPHKAVAHLFQENAPLAEETAFRNGTLQAAYLMLALRAVGLDLGPMSGFDKAKVDAAFFPDGRYRTNFLLNVGRGDPSKLFERLPRLGFDQVAEIL